MRVLGVSENPTTGEVRRARKAAARLLHPDVAGDRAALRFADVNAACDEWIAEIRAQHAAEAQHSRAAPPARAGDLPARYAVATLALIVVAIACTIIVAGFSAASIAAGTLLGAGAAGAYLTVLYRTMRQRR